MVEGVTAAELDRAFRKNKLATSALADSDVGTPLAEEPPLADSIPEHETQLRLHGERIGRVEEVLDGGDLEYLHVKKLRNPYSVMADVDLLVPDPDDVVRVSERLVGEGYTLKQSRLLCHPLKVNAHKYVDGQNNPVDIYPDILWVRKKVCDGADVLDRGVTARFDGTAVPVPDPEDSLYIVATHAYAHMRVTLAEVLHGLAVFDGADSFDWDRIVDDARAYGSMDGTYLYLRVMRDYAEQYRDDQPVPARVLDDLAGARACRRLERWYAGAADPLVLPLSVPKRIACLASSAHYLRRSVGTVSPSDALYGTLTHYVILANQVI